MDEAAILARFLDLYRADLDGDGVRSLSEYQAMFPGFEDLVAREYLDLGGPAATTTSDVPPRLPGWIGPFRILGEIARGGQGDVYLAEDPRLHRQLALKILHGKGAFTEQALFRFRREAEVTARLDHPGICPVYEAATVDGISYIAMRYVPGRSLAQRISDSKSGSSAGAEPAERRGEGVPAGQRAPPPDREAVDAIVGLARQVALALHAAHEQGIIHRDVKPGNIMVTPASEAVLVDFGFARQEDSEHTLTQSGDVFGTPAYMSPEQLAREAIRIDRRTDVWSLGVTLYEALTLARPFEAPTREALHRAILTATPADARRINPAIGRDLRTVLDTALEKDRDRRYQTAAALADDLGAVLEGRPIAAKPVGPWARLTRWGAREPAKAGLLAMALVAVPTIAALVALRIQDRPRLEAQARAEREARRDDCLLDAQAWFEEGHPDKSIPEFEAALELDPGSIEAILGLAMAHHARSRHDDALRVLDVHATTLRDRRPAIWLRNTILRKTGRDGEATPGPLPPPRDPVDWYLDGQQHMREAEAGRKNAYREALNCFLSAIILSNAPRLPYYTYGVDAAGHAGDRAAVLWLDRALVRFWPESATAHHWRAYALGLVGEDEPEIAAYREAVRLRPDFAIDRHNLGSNLGRKGEGHREEALVHLREAVRLEPSYASAFNSLGVVLMESGKIDEAIAAYDRAIALEPNHAHARSNRGSAYAMLGRDDEALADYEAAVESKPDDARSLDGIGDVLKKKGQRNRALDAYRRAAACSDAGPYVFQDLAGMLDEIGRHEEAVSVWEKAAASRPTDAEFQYSLGCYLADHGRDAEAVTAYRRAVDARPGHGAAWCNMGLALRNCGKLDAALEACLRAAELEPRDKFTFVNLSDLFIRTERYADAEKAALRALDIDPDFPEALCNLGWALRELGRFREAQRHLRRGHDLGKARREPAWPYPSGEWVREIDELVSVEERMERVVSGAEPAKGPDETIRFADFAARTKRWDLAAKWYAAVCDENPEMVQGPRVLRAALVMVQACDSPGAETRASADDVARWRRRARDLLHRELRTLEEDHSAEQIREAVSPWLAARGLASVRDEPGTSRLDAADAAAWKELWDQIRAAAK